VNGMKHDFPPTAAPKSVRLGASVDLSRIDLYNEGYLKVSVK
jgi:hypothetical protein